MEFQPEEFEEILNIFRSETEEIVQKLNNNLLQLEINPNNKELLVYLFRDAHSLKGAARMVGFNNIQRLAHKAEDVLGLAKENKIKINNAISDALYKATDLLNELIQESVKIKKEYYTDDIQKQIDFIDSLIEEHEIEAKTKSSISKTDEDNVSSDSDIQFLKKNHTTINALIAEAYLILLNISKEGSKDNIDVFFDTINQLSGFFRQTDFYEINCEINNLKSKFDFVIHNSNVITNDEQKETDERLTNIVASLNSIYESNGIEKFDYKNAAVEKIKKENAYNSEREKRIEKTQSKSSITDFVSKIDFVKNGLNKLENNLAQIPQLRKSLDALNKSEENNEISKIISKIDEILEIIKTGQSLPEKEVIGILKQSLATVEKIKTENNEETEDSFLVLQRLDIIRQMLDINSSVNPLTNLSTTLNESALPVKKVQDFFNSFESTSIRTLRVDSKKLDRLVNQMGELIIGRIKHKKNTSELENILQDLAEWKNFNNKSQSFVKYYDRKYLSSTQHIDDKNLSVFSKQIFSILQENSTKILKLNNKVLSLQKAIDEEDTKQSLIITQLEGMVKNIRVLPLATIFHMFPRMIRDISQDTGKDIELLISGSETSADKKVIEEIKAPLMHIIRNSIDHGIEPPKERIAAGKHPKGKIHLFAKSFQNKIIIEVHDDGRGIDLQKIVNRALEKNLITKKEADYLSAEQIMNIIFWPGFSTEQVVTEISGRGVGLDIVQTKITQLNGKVKIFSVPEKGTKITIELPISMSTLKSFIVETSNQFFALPMASIKTVMWVKTNDIYMRNDTKSIIIDGKTVNIFFLSDLMNLQQDEETTHKEKYTVVLLEAENSLLGIIVDKILGDQDILQKKLEPPIVKLKHISGITTLANGEVCLILNIPELYKTTYTPIEKQFIAPPKQNAKTKTNNEFKILIVDDSVTTRELLKNILVHWGYNFEIVSNPYEAFEKLYKDNFDIILSDMEMPEMDGGMFVKELKTHIKFKNIPIIIISSYETEKLAKEMPDVDAFIKKSNFNQDYLLDTIEKLLKYD